MKLGTAQVKTRKWKGPTANSEICSEHFSADFFDSTLAAVIIRCCSNYGIFPTQHKHCPHLIRSHTLLMLLKSENVSGRTAPWPCRSAVFDRAEQSSVPAPAASAGHPRTRMPTARALLQDAQTRDPPVDAGLGQTSSAPENTLLSHGGMFNMLSAGGVLARPN